MVLLILYKLVYPSIVSNFKLHHGENKNAWQGNTMWQQNDYSDDSLPGAETQNVQGAQAQNIIKN